MGLAMHLYPLIVISSSPISYKHRVDNLRCIELHVR